MDPLVHILDVKKSYRIGPLDLPVLRGVDHHIYDGEFVANSGADALVGTWPASHPELPKGDGTTISGKSLRQTLALRGNATPWRPIICPVNTSQKKAG